MVNLVIFKVKEYTKRLEVKSFPHTAALDEYTRKCNDKEELMKFIEKSADKEKLQAIKNFICVNGGRIKFGFMTKENGWVDTNILYSNNSFDPNKTIEIFRKYFLSVTNGVPNYLDVFKNWHLGIEKVRIEVKEGILPVEKINQILTTNLLEIILNSFFKKKKGNDNYKKIRNTYFALINHGIIDINSEKKYEQISLLSFLNDTDSNEEHDVTDDLVMASFDNKNMSNEEAYMEYLKSQSEDPTWAEDEFHRFSGPGEDFPSSHYTKKRELSDKSIEE